MIPATVLEVLAAIRESGSIDLSDHSAVLEIAAIMDESAARWLHDNKAEYMQALEQMGAVVSEEK